MVLAPMLGPVREMGEFIREQRQAARLSLRGLAAKAGISNPYLSQVERGLRRPSADTLALIAKGLSISAESLLTMAGVLPESTDDLDGTATDTARTGATGSKGSTGVISAVHADPALSERHKAALIEIYSAFAAERPGPVDNGVVSGENPDGDASRAEPDIGTPA